MKTRTLTLSLEQLRTLKDFVRLEFAARLAGRFIKVIETGPTKREAPVVLCSEALAAHRDVEILFDAVNMWTVQIARHPDAKVMMSFELHSLFSKILNRPYDDIIKDRNEKEEKIRAELIGNLPGIVTAFNTAEVVEFDPKNPTQPLKKTPVLLN